MLEGRLLSEMAPPPVPPPLDAAPPPDFGDGRPRSARPYGDATEATFGFGEAFDDTAEPLAALGTFAVWRAASCATTTTSTTSKYRRWSVSYKRNIVARWFRIASKPS
eukprot:g495.t1